MTNSQLTGELEGQFDVVASVLGDDFIPIQPVRARLHANLQSDCDHWSPDPSFVFVPYVENLQLRLTEIITSTHMFYTFLDLSEYTTSAGPEYTEQHPEKSGKPYILTSLDYDGLGLRERSNDYTQSMIAARCPLTIFEAFLASLYFQDMLTYKSGVVAGASIRPANPEKGEPAMRVDFYEYSGRYKIKREAVGDDDTRWNIPSHNYANVVFP